MEEKNIKAEDVWQSLEIKSDTDKATLVSILAMNGYTVRIFTIREPNNKPKKVLQYRKDGKV